MSSAVNFQECNGINYPKERVAVVLFLKLGRRATNDPLAPSKSKEGTGGIAGSTARCLEQLWGHCRDFGPRMGNN